MGQQAEALKAELRTNVGKGASRELRRNSMVPAVIYGGKKEPVTIALPYKELSARIHGGGFMTTIATIDVGGEQHQVLPKDYQEDPVRDFITHVDFFRVDKDSRVVVMIPVHFLNEKESPGLDRGGVLNVVRHEVELECGVMSMPDFVEVDLTGLDVGDSVHISAVKLPEGVVPTITDRDFTIATVAAPAALTAEEEAGEAPDEEVETEIIGEESEEGEDAGEADGEGEAKEE